MALARGAQSVLASIAAPMLGPIENAVPSTVVAMLASLPVSLLAGWGVSSHRAAVLVVAPKLASLARLAYGAECRRALANMRAVRRTPDHVPYRIDGCASIYGSSGFGVGHG